MPFISKIFYKCLNLAIPVFLLWLSANISYAQKLQFDNPVPPDLSMWSVSQRVAAQLVTEADELGLRVLNTSDERIQIVNQAKCHWRRFAARLLTADDYEADLSANPGSLFNLQHASYAIIAGYTLYDAADAIDSSLDKILYLVNPQESVAQLRQFNINAEKRLEDNSLLLTAAGVDNYCRLVIEPLLCAVQFVETDKPVGSWHTDWIFPDTVQYEYGIALDTISQELQQCLNDSGIDQQYKEWFFELLATKVFVTGNRCTKLDIYRKADFIHLLIKLAERIYTHKAEIPAEFINEYMQIVMLAADRCDEQYDSAQLDENIVRKLRQLILIPALLDDIFAMRSDSTGKQKIRVVPLDKILLWTTSLNLEDVSTNEWFTLQFIEDTLHHSLQYQQLRPPAKSLELRKACKLIETSYYTCETALLNRFADSSDLPGNIVDDPDLLSTMARHTQLYKIQAYLRSYDIWLNNISQIDATAARQMKAYVTGLCGIPAGIFSYDKVESSLAEFQQQQDVVLHLWQISNNIEDGGWDIEQLVKDYLQMDIVEFQEVLQSACKVWISAYGSNNSNEIETSSQVISQIDRIIKLAQSARNMKILIDKPEILDQHAGWQLYQAFPAEQYDQLCTELPLLGQTIKDIILSRSVNKYHKRNNSGGSRSGWGIDSDMFSRLTTSLEQLESAKVDIASVIVNLNKISCIDSKKDISYSTISSLSQLIFYPDYIDILEPDLIQCRSLMSQYCRYLREADNPLATMPRELQSELSVYVDYLTNALDSQLHTLVNN